MWSGYYHPGTHITFPVPVLFFLPGWEECLGASFPVNAETSLVLRSHYTGPWNL